MPTEARIVESIMSHLKARYHSGWYGFKVHGDQYTVNQPDIVGVLNGQAVAIECKKPGKASRPAQDAIQRKWEKAGALVVKDATSWKEVRAALQRWGMWDGDGPSK